MELYKKYRPQDFDSVVGNKAAVMTLRKKVAAKDVPQVILFHGPSGCGKTTLARILATELGCHERDLVEKNSSDYRGIDSVRDLIRVSTLSPNGDCKVTIMDETHKMTNDAQNAILKLLEDTPRRSYYFLCTTDPQKMIKAIRTRCTPIEVELLKKPQMIALLKSVCGEEKIKISDRIRDLIIDRAEGSARQALVFLDRVYRLEEDDQKSALSVEIGDQETPEVRDLCQALCFGKADWKKVREILKSLGEQDPESIRISVFNYAGAVLENQDNETLYRVGQSFSKPFYDNACKRRALTFSCYEVIKGL